MAMRTVEQWVRERAESARSKVTRRRFVEVVLPTDVSSGQVAVFEVSSARDPGRVGTLRYFATHEMSLQIDGGNGVRLPVGSMDMNVLLFQTDANDVVHNELHLRFSSAVVRLDTALAALAAHCEDGSFVTMPSDAGPLALSADGSARALRQFYADLGKLQHSLDAQEVLTWTRERWVSSSLRVRSSGQMKFSNVDVPFREFFLEDFRLHSMLEVVVNSADDAAAAPLAFCVPLVSMARLLDTLHANAYGTLLRNPWAVPNADVLWTPETAFVSDARSSQGYGFRLLASGVLLGEPLSGDGNADAFLLSLENYSLRVDADNRVVLLLEESAADVGSAAGRPELSLFFSNVRKSRLALQLALRAASVYNLSSEMLKKRARMEAASERVTAYYNGTTTRVLAEVSATSGELQLSLVDGTRQGTVVFTANASRADLYFSWRFAYLRPRSPRHAQYMLHFSESDWFELAKVCLRSFSFALEEPVAVATSVGSTLPMSPLAQPGHILAYQAPVLMLWPEGVWSRRLLALSGDGYLYLARLPRGVRRSNASVAAAASAASDVSSQLAATSQTPLSPSLSAVTLAVFAFSGISTGGVAEIDLALPISRLQLQRISDDEAMICHGALTFVLRFTNRDDLDFFHEVASAKHTEQCDQLSPAMAAVTAIGPYLHGYAAPPSVAYNRLRVLLPMPIDPGRLRTYLRRNELEWLMIDALEVSLYDALDSHLPMQRTMARWRGADVSVVIGRAATTLAGPDNSLAVSASADVLQHVLTTATVGPHPNIIPVFGVCAWPTTSAIAQIEPFYVDGHVAISSAKQRLDPGRLEAVIAGLAAALSHLHRMRVVHCNIQPSALYFDGGRAILGKLTHAQLLSEVADVAVQTRHSARSLRYRAPETMQHGWVSTQSDVWMLGALMLSLARGVEPYSDAVPVADDQASTAVAVVSHAVSGGAATLRGLVDSTELGSVWKGVVRAMLDPNPMKRPTAYEILQQMA